MDYLNQLAQYKLGKCVAEEVKYFLKGAQDSLYQYLYTHTGLHELIPDDLLSMFDENELEVIIIIESDNYIVNKLLVIDVWCPKTKCR